MAYRQTRFAHMLCRRFLPAVWTLILIGLSVVLPGVAQQDRGTILGTILDSSGAAIPNANIVVENQGTAAKRQITTDAAGLFVAPELPVGTYRVTASVEGFKTKIQE